MSKFTQNEETEIVKSARDITATIEYEEREVKRLKSETKQSILSFFNSSNELYFFIVSKENSSNSNNLLTFSIIFSLP